ncbi:MAG: GNAT family N-acetyltransferase [Candidatus Delongbacteria bacterium]|nr:GNAT family N-acetyltransferase [Candidatus Delongbacteria bacterium]MBN2834748.1 GNAT family N-acetyltransferase [Candidatus Delongbacteria bacterium]
MPVYEIKEAELKHLDFFEKNDPHINKNMIIKKIETKEILIMELNNQIIGWLRFGYFWDVIPFMNMLIFLKEYRNKGYGTLLVRAWEKKLYKAGYKTFFTSTMANEEAQHFFRNLGYHDIGGFVMPSEPMELIMMKEKTDALV